MRENLIRALFREKPLEEPVIVLYILFTVTRIIRLTATHLMQIRKISFTWQGIVFMIYIYRKKASLFA